MRECFYYGHWKTTTSYVAQCAADLYDGGMHDLLQIYYHMVNQHIISGADVTLHNFMHSVGTMLYGGVLDWDIRQPALVPTLACEFPESRIEVWARTKEFPWWLVDLAKQHRWNLVCGHLSLTPWTYYGAVNRITAHNDPVTVCLFRDQGSDIVSGYRVDPRHHLHRLCLIRTLRQRYPERFPRGKEWPSTLGWWAFHSSLRHPQKLWDFEKEVHAEVKARIKVVRCGITDEQAKQFDMEGLKAVMWTRRFIPHSTLSLAAMPPAFIEQEVQSAVSGIPERVPESPPVSSSANLAAVEDEK